jgi:hypothetical protein
VSRSASKSEPVEANRVTVRASGTADKASSRTRRTAATLLRVALHKRVDRVSLRDLDRVVALTASLTKNDLPKTVRAAADARRLLGI